MKIFMSLVLTIVLMLISYGVGMFLFGVSAHPNSMFDKFGIAVCGLMVSFMLSTIFVGIYFLLDDLFNK